MRLGTHKDLTLLVAWCSVYEAALRELTLINRKRNMIEYEGCLHSHGARSCDANQMRLAFKRHPGLRLDQIDCSYRDVMPLRGVAVGCLEWLLAGRSVFEPLHLAADEVRRVRHALEMLHA